VDGPALSVPLRLASLRGLSSITTSHALDGIELLSGGYPAVYGGRMSGVVDLSTRRPGAAASSSLELSSVNSGYLSLGPLASRDGGWLVSMRAWRPDAVVDMVDPGGEGIN